MFMYLKALQYFKILAWFGKLLIGTNLEKITYKDEDRNGNFEKKSQNRDICLKKTEALKTRVDIQAQT